MDEYKKIKENIVHLSRLALSGRRQDIQTYVRRIARNYKTVYPDLSDELSGIVREAPSNDSPVRSSGMSQVPVDLDSRLQLVRLEQFPTFDFNPIWMPEVLYHFDQLISERSKEKELLKEGLFPTKSVLFVGPPGVGKTLGARWLAAQLKKPLLILDLSAVMSSFLGRTGANLRNVIDYAKSIDCILLLDELDAVAKRRDDAGEIGELKRLVTVMLQEIDDWPHNNLLIGATNHPDLLDPAIWRRFDLHVHFPLPDAEHVAKTLSAYLKLDKSIDKGWEEILTILFTGKSFSDIERNIMKIRRESVIQQKPMEELMSEYIRAHFDSLPRQQKTFLAANLNRLGISQRKVQDMTGVSRDTIRRAKLEIDNNNNAK